VLSYIQRKGMYVFCAGPKIKEIPLNLDENNVEADF
jgi:hypothetical protein